MYLHPHNQTAYPTRLGFVEIRVSPHEAIKGQCVAEGDRGLGRLMMQLSVEFVRLGGLRSYGLAR
jgi:hypothetical protein